MKEVKKSSDHEKLQEDLEATIQWAKENNMELNENKFQLMQYGNDDELKEHYDISEDTTLSNE